MKFVKVVEDGITKVILDLEAVTLPAFKLESRDTVCVFEGTHDFDFTIVNEFLASQNESTLSYIARTLIDMRRCIVNSGHDDPAADECVGELSLIMHDLFDNLLISPTVSLFGDLYSFSAKYTTPDKVNLSYFKNDRQMLAAASLLSALCITIIHTFETHFTDVDDPVQILYPVFEETIRDSDVAGAKKFVEKCRSLVSAEGIYINECMLHKHKIREMKEINEVEEQQRMKNNEAKIENEILIDTALIAALIVKRAALSRGNTYLSDNARIAYCNEIIKDVDKVIMELNNRSSALAQRIMCSCNVSIIVNTICTEINIYVNQGIDEKFGDYNEITNNTRLFFIRGKFYLPPDVIIDAIADMISTTSILNSHLLESYIPYSTLRERLQAFGLVVPQLNPDAGSIVTTLIQSSSKINIGDLTSAIDSQNYK